MDHEHTWGSCPRGRNHRLWRARMEGEGKLCFSIKKPIGNGMDPLVKSSMDKRSDALCDYGGKIDVGFDELASQNLPSYQSKVFYSQYQVMKQQNISIINKILDLVISAQVLQHNFDCFEVGEYRLNLIFRVIINQIRPLLMKAKKDIEMQLLPDKGKQSSEVKVQYVPPHIPFPQSLFMTPRPIPQARVIYLDGNLYPLSISQPNIINNSKYTIISFFPLVLYHQFRYFFNLFFLIIALSQFINMLKVGFLFTYIAPLLLVLGFTIFKEAYDDYYRKKRDQETNNQTYTLIEKTGVKEIRSKDMKVGQVVEVKSNQRIPADMIILSTSEEDGTVFIRTDQLDGETDWKLRKAVNFTHQYLQNNNQSNLIGLLATVNAEAPKLDIYNFEGCFKMESSTQSNGCREGINLENTLWGNCFLANGKAIGIIVYAGREMRSVMNTHESRQKMGKTDDELNYLSKVLFVFMIILAALIVLSGGLGEYWLLDLFRQILLLSSIIPISLRVNMDISKTVFSYRINNDTEIDGSLARNSQIPEELGRVHYILSDKTGTLTQNEMVFKKLSINDVGSYKVKDQKLLKLILKKNYDTNKGPMSDIEVKMNECRLTGKKYKPSKRDKYFIVRDFICCLAVCHNVTPSMQNEVKTYQASSPDEIALVKIAESLGLILEERSLKEIIVKNPSNGARESFRILQIFPFTSASKRMGIIVQHVDTGRIIFYMKGADTVMKDKVSETLRGFVLDECEDLSREGLRTLVLAQKLLSDKEYNDWKKQYDEAASSMINREATMTKVVESLQTNMQLLGITGVQDKLQENIQECISQLRNAGINIWMITGDKVETAICIGISAGLKSPTQDLFVIKEQNEPYTLKNKLNEFSTKTNTVLVIDGSSLAVALHQVPDFFYTVAAEAPAVICCRVSPTQKAVITKGVKDHTGKIVLGIGDGGNDVGMIQVADIGVGIVGKEGKQAALASDFSILKFKHLSKLILWHGRLAYKNTSVMAQFVIHRGLIISIIQCIFSLVFYSVAIPIYNGYLMLGYTTIYTMLPVICLIFDEDVSLEKVREFPQLYRSLQKGRELNLKTFLIWVWKSIYQGAIIMLLTFWLFEKSFTTVVTITFTALILSELLNVNTTLTKMNKIVCLSQIFTLLFYIVSIILLRKQIDLSVINLPFIKNVAIIVFFSWAPLQLIKLLRMRFDPTENEKIMKDIKNDVKPPSSAKNLAI